ncbi:MBL fold metallo-hydrolase [Aquimarina algiphila]|uniref:MBL fold metallo-hydrolase n=1 Tax=Aquimarina algiphila TaxID=2047982 RepID=UPI00233055A2|nr:MBL fold metallo-hydrolase [Aquimarina algiphila]
MVNVTISSKRNPEVQNIILYDIRITSWGAIQVNNSDFFPSSFQIKTKEKIIYIDPVEVTNAEKADYIFITHSHPDHFSLKTIEQIATSETILICSKSVFKKLSKKKYLVKQVKPGSVIILDTITSESITAYNTKNVFLWIKAHPKSKKNVGFILTLENGIRIYHAGDTDYIPEMKNLKNINIAMIPVGGDNLTMNIEEAAKMINTIKPNFVIPMHYELRNSNDIITFKNLVDKEIKVKIFE